MTAREQQTHVVKCSSAYFDAVLRGAKKFEVRLDDRDYRVGDRLHLQEVGESLAFTGRDTWALVTYRLELEPWGAPGMVVLSIDRILSDPVSGEAVVEGERIPAVHVTLSVPADHDAEHDTTDGWCLRDIALSVHVDGNRLVLPSQLGRALVTLGGQLVAMGDQEIRGTEGGG